MGHHDRRQPEDWSICSRATAGRGVPGRRDPTLSPRPWRWGRWRAGIPWLLGTLLAALFVGGPDREPATAGEREVTPGWREARARRFHRPPEARLRLERLLPHVIHVDASRSFGRSTGWSSTDSG
jgi:hypothetical protein